MNGRWKLLATVIALGGLLGMLLAGCAVRPAPPAPAPTATTAPPLAASPQTPAPHVGTPYDVNARESLLAILVYRGGTLASAGHNHVIASHDLTGTLYVPADPLQSSFELHVPVASLTVDEPALRAEQASAEFPPDVSEGAKQGTRHNMLGPALLDADNSPEIVLRAVRMEKTAEADGVLAQALCTVRGQAHTLAIPVRYQRRGAELVVSGEMPLRQSDLGLTPFSAMLGALQVKDEMRVSFRIVARAATQ
ncbi:MAG: YceI family protein [Gammaproteobacteria bacterium]|nr:YceI family protein [Gammaproteobacteria bacterium]